MKKILFLHGFYASGQCSDAHGYIMIAFFMCLGIGLKFIPGMPIEFFAGFYPGLGTALSIAVIRYFISWCKAI